MKNSIYFFLISPLWKTAYISSISLELPEITNYVEHLWYILILMFCRKNQSLCNFLICFQCYFQFWKKVVLAVSERSMCAKFHLNLPGINTAWFLDTYKKKKIKHLSEKVYHHVETLRFFVTYTVYSLQQKNLQFWYNWS